MLDPEQFAPPSDGEGLVQVRKRSFVPFPQVTLHFPQCPQSPHPPSTGAVKRVFQKITGKLFLFRNMFRSYENIFFVVLRFY